MTPGSREGGEGGGGEEMNGVRDRVSDPCHAEEGDEGEEGKPGPLP